MGRLERRLLVQIIKSRANWNFEFPQGFSGSIGSAGGWMKKSVRKYAKLYGPEGDDQT
jgi:hypothetical protein